MDNIARFASLRSFRSKATLFGILMPLRGPNFEQARNATAAIIEQKLEGLCSKLPQGFLDSVRIYVQITYPTC